MNSRLRKVIVGLLGTVALAGFSSQASAFGGEAYSIGAFTGATINSTGHAAPFKSWTDYGAENLGWVHTAGFATLQVGSASDIANGVTYNVVLTMTGEGSAGLATASTLDNPAFTVWTGGANPTSTGGGGFHKFNQLRGPSGPGESLTTNDALTSGGVLAGSNGWVGYANSGFVVANSGGNTVAHGGVNGGSPWLTNPGASSWSYSQLNQNNSSTALDYASLTLAGLKSGYYLLALGGSCGDPNPASNCGIGQNYGLQVSAAPVPIPAAAWLFGSAVMGLLGIGRRKSTAA
ncbi:hypothetical protein [Methylomagnum sp.]